MQLCSPARLGLGVSTAVLLKRSRESHPLPWPHPPPKAMLPVPQPPTGSGLAAAVHSCLLAFTLALEARRIPFPLAVAFLGLSASPLLPSSTLQRLGTSLLPPCAPTSPGRGPGVSSRSSPGGGRAGAPGGLLYRGRVLGEPPGPAPSSSGAAWAVLEVAAPLAGFPSHAFQASAFLARQPAPWFGAAEPPRQDPASPRGAASHGRPCAHKAALGCAHLASTWLPRRGRGRRRR